MELNDVKLFGRVVRNAELKVTSSGLKIANFSIATNRSCKNDKGEHVSVGHFFPLSIYGQYAEKVYPLLTKGRKVIIDGFLRQDRWEKDGVKKSAVAIGVNRIQIIFDPKNDGQSHESSASARETGFSEEQMQRIYRSEPDGMDFLEDDEAYAEMDDAGDNIF